MMARAWSSCCCGVGVWRWTAPITFAFASIIFAASALAPLGASSSWARWAWSKRAACGSSTASLAEAFGCLHLELVVEELRDGDVLRCETRAASANWAGDTEAVVPPPALTCLIRAKRVRAGAPSRGALRTRGSTP